MARENTSENEKARGSSPLLAAVLAWMLPGAGHLYLARHRRALSFGALVLVSLVVGCALHGRLPVMVPDQPLSRIATIGSMGMGIPYFVARFGLRYEGDLLSSGYEYGSAFILTAGLMNLLLVLDAWDVARGVKD